jgi:hypothetical protein
MLGFGMMKHLAKVSHVEILSADGAMLEMLRLGLDRLVVISALEARAFVVGPIFHLRSRKSQSFRPSWNP